MTSITDPGMFVPTNSEEYDIEPHLRDLNYKQAASLLDLMSPK